jgi:hypothetical protein
MNKKLSLLTVSIAALTLTACAGGGGGGGSSSSNGNVTTTATGFSGQATWTSAGAGGALTNIGTYDQSTSGLTYTETVDSSNVVQSNSFTSALGTTVSFDRAQGDTIANIPTGPLANKAYAEIKSNGNDLAIISPASMNGWSYQSYGVWITNINGSSGTVGGGSVGSLTTGVAIPTTGTANFSGTSAGVYSNSIGDAYLTGSSMSASVNFATRSLGFATTGTQILLSNGTWQSTSGLNTTGTLSYASGTNLVTGSNLATAGGGGVAVMTGGTVTGKFYGPAANELGGTFAVRAGAGVESYTGAFGSKR